MIIILICYVERRDMRLITISAALIAAVYAGKTAMSDAYRPRIEAKAKRGLARRGDGLPPLHPDRICLDWNRYDEAKDRCDA